MQSPAGPERDGQLLVRIAAGDRQALRQLYLEYHRRLHRFLMRVTRDAALAEEIVNDTMMIVWRGAGGFRGESRVSTWILGVAYRRALKALAVQRRQLPRDESAAIETGPGEFMTRELPQPGPIPTDALELQDWLATALESLSAEQRLTIELAYFEGLSCEEIAAIAGCPVGTVKTRMHHARLKLHGFLTEMAEPRREAEPQRRGVPHLRPVKGRVGDRDGEGGGSSWRGPRGRT